MTMSQMPVPDVTQELADGWALHALFAAAQRNEERLSGHDCSPDTLTDLPTASL